MGSSRATDSDDQVTGALMPKAKPKFTKAYSFGLVTGLFFLLSLGRTIHLPDDHRAERGRATWAGLYLV